MDILRKVKKKLLRPSVLKRKVVCGERNPRNSKEENQEVIELPWDKDVICKALSKDFEKWNNTEKTLILINLNTADPYPASTNAQTLEIVIDELIRSGMKKIFVGACSSNSKLPSK